MRTYLSPKFRWYTTRQTGNQFHGVQPLFIVRRGLLFRLDRIRFIRIRCILLPLHIVVLITVVAGTVVDVDVAAIATVATAMIVIVVIIQLVCRRTVTVPTIPSGC